MLLTWHRWEYTQVYVLPDRCISEYVCWNVFTESVKEKLLDQLSPNLRSIIDEYLIANDRLKLDKEIGRGRVKVTFSYSLLPDV